MTIRLFLIIFINNYMSQNTTSTDRSNMFYWQVDRPFTPLETKEIFLDRYTYADEEEIKKAMVYGLTQYGLSESQAQIIEFNPPGKVLSSVNLIYSAKTASGLEVIIRVHPQQAKNGYFWVEKVATDLANQQGVPTYKTYFVDDSGSNFPFDYMIIEKLPGDTMQLLWPIDPELDRQLVSENGKYLALIHQIQTQKYGFFNNAVAKTEGKLMGIHNKWNEHIYAAFDKNIKFLLDNQVFSQDDCKKINQIFGRNEDLIKCDKPCLIHNDLADWNELAYQNHISGILDWDECFSGDPIMDFAAWSVFFPFERMKHLITGYQTMNPLPAGYMEKLHLYRLRYIVSKCVTRKTKILIAPNARYQEMLDFGLKILKEEFTWYGL
jgi:fructosamine-3-kinase